MCKKNVTKKGNGFMFLGPIALLALSLGTGAVYAKDAISHEEASASYEELMNKGATEDEVATVVEVSATETTESSEENSVSVVADAATTEAAEEDVILEESSIEYPEYTGTDVATLAEINPDFVGVISVPAVDTMYPVVQGEDNERYLHEDFGDNASVNGCIFLDAAASHDMSDENTFVFGHNMRNGDMFGKLKYFAWAPETVSEDPFVYLYGEDVVYKYHIFAVRTVDANNDIYYGMDYVGGYDKYLSVVTDGNLINEEIGDALASHPHLLTLSTCYGESGSGQRLIVVAFLEGTAEN